MKISRRRARSLGLGALMALLIACGGSDEPADTGVASVDDLAPTTTTIIAATTDAGAESTATVVETTASIAVTDDPEQMTPIEEQEIALLAFSACMRDEGIDEFPDLSVDNNGAIDVAAVFQSGVNPQSPEFLDAVDVCDDNVEGITFGAAAVPDPAQIVEQLFGFTQCLRDEGIDVGDVSLLELLPRQTNVPEGASRDEAIAYFFEMDPDDPAVIAAIGLCEGELAGLPGA